MNQRWELGKARWRSDRETIRPEDYEVAEIPDDTTARAFVALHHYSHEYVAARYRFGLYRHGTLVGVAVFSQPVNNRTLTNSFPVHPLEACELGRLVLLDEVPGNGESWFMARCFAALRKVPVVERKTGREFRGMLGIVSFSDPAPRRTLSGDVVLPGHVGTIYQALGGVYIGRGTARTIRVLPDGTVLNERSIQKVRKLEKGWRGQTKKLQSYGADEPWEDRLAWLSHWISRLTRPLSHQGNHKYVFPIHPVTRNHVPKSLPYPKMIDPEVA